MVTFVEASDREGTSVSPSRLFVTGRSYTFFHDYVEQEDKATR